MNKNLDLRVQKTYTCLMNAMLALLKEKEFEEITVNELCEKALVGRGTFYKHFSDKYEFFSFVLNEMLSHYLQKAEEKAGGDDPRLYYVAFFEAFIQFIENNHDAFGPPTSRSMITVMLFSTSDAIAQKLEEHFQADVSEGYYLALRPASAARFLTGAMAQSARYLLTHPDEAKKKELVSDMKILVDQLYTEKEK